MLESCGLPPFMPLKLHLQDTIPSLTSSVTQVHPSLLTHSAGKLLTSGVKVKHSCQQVRLWDDTEKAALTLYFSQCCQLLTLIMS